MAINLRDKAYNAIKDKILTGRIGHSDFLNEAELMKELAGHQFAKHFPDWNRKALFLYFLKKEF